MQASCAKKSILTGIICGFIMTTPTILVKREEAAKCLEHGIRRTTVDKIVKRVNIPKGAFYLYYPSGELLLFEASLQAHDAIDEELCNAVGQINPAGDIGGQLTAIIVRFYSEAAENSILLRKLPPNVIENHLASGTTALERVFAALPINPKADGSAFCAAFRAVYFATPHKEEIGKDQLAGALRLLVKGLINQLL